ncbi:hypothetical protein ACFE04_024206 [Oxalis oulophora]
MEWLFGLIDWRHWCGERLEIVECGDERRGVIKITKFKENIKERGNSKYREVSNEDNEVECSRRNVASADGNNNSEAEFVGNKGKDNSSSDDEPCDDELVYDYDATEGLESSDGDDEELQRARNQLKHQKTKSKRNGIEGLVGTERNSWCDIRT